MMGIKWEHFANNCLSHECHDVKWNEVEICHMAWNVHKINQIVLHDTQKDSSALSHIACQTIFWLLSAVEINVDKKN